MDEPFSKEKTTSRDSSFIRIIYFSAFKNGKQT